jgi:hypothetical protein
MGQRWTFGWRSWNIRSKWRTPSNSFRHSFGTKQKTYKKKKKLKCICLFTEWLINIKRLYSQIWWFLFSRINIFKYIVNGFLWFFVRHKKNKKNVKLPNNSIETVQEFWYIHQHWISQYETKLYIAKKNED